MLTEQEFKELRNLKTNEKVRTKLFLSGEEFKNLVYDPLKNDIWGHFVKMMEEQNKIYQEFFKIRPLNSVDNIKNISEEIYHYSKHNHKYYPKKIYNIVPYTNLINILSNGLNPKTNFNSEIVYFLTVEPNEQLIKNFILKSYKINVNETYVVLEIDLDRASYTIDGSDRPPIKLLKELNSEDEIFTIESMHPRSLTPTKLIQITIEDECKTSFGISITTI